MTYCISDGTDYLSSFDNASISYATPEKPVLVFADRWEAEYVARGCNRLANIQLIVEPLEVWEVKK